MDALYEVLSPWADVDPMPLLGISPRLTDMKDKKIGLFACTSKIGARPALTVVERKLKEKFPSLTFTSFKRISNVSVAETKDKPKFEEWLKGVDAVILAIGD